MAQFGQEDGAMDAGPEGRLMLARLVAGKFLDAGATVAAHLAVEGAAGE